MILFSYIYGTQRLHIYVLRVKKQVCVKGLFLLQFHIQSDFNVIILLQKTDLHFNLNTDISRIYKQIPSPCFSERICIQIGIKHSCLCLLEILGQ